MSWFRCPAPRPFASLRLICFPHAGGSAVFYRPWSEAVSPAVEVHAVQYPGRADRLRDPLIPDLPQIARLVAGAVAPLLDRPLVFFGHSMGAAVAYEAARVLQARGNAPVHLFVSSAIAPQDRSGVARVSDGDDEALVAEMSRLGGTEAEILQDREMREIVLPYVRNDFHAIEHYVRTPGPPLTIPVTAITGDADPDVTPERNARWSEATTGAFKSLVLPGDHFYLVPQQTAVITEVLTTLNVPVTT
jgi:surfactin synthase thioesterase subunit